VVAGEYYIVEGNVTDPNNGGTVRRGDLAVNSAVPLNPKGPLNVTRDMNGTIDTSSPDSLDLGNYTVFIRGQDARGVWTNESLDGYTGKSFEITEGGSSDPANNIEPNLGGTGAEGSSGKYNFELNNTGDTDLSLVGIGINSTTSNNAEQVGGGGGDTILTADGTQIVSNTIDFDSDTNEAQRYNLTTNQTIETNPASPISFQFNRFRDGTGGGNSKVDMSGQDVTITLWVVLNGNEDSTTITLDS
jgi:hypothetical protein